MPERDFERRRMSWLWALTILSAIAAVLATVALLTRVV